MLFLFLELFHIIFISTYSPTGASDLDVRPGHPWRPLHYAAAQILKNPFQQRAHLRLHWPMTIVAIKIHVKELADWLPQALLRFACKLRSLSDDINVFEMFQKINGTTKEERLSFFLCASLRFPGFFLSADPRTLHAPTSCNKMMRMKTNQWYTNFLSGLE